MYMGCSPQHIGLQPTMMVSYGTRGCRMAAETATFVKSLRNFLRGPSDDATLRDELYELAEARLISREQAAKARLR